MSSNAFGNMISMSAVSNPVSNPIQTSQWGAGHPKLDIYLDFHGSVDDPAIQKLMQALGLLMDKLLVLNDKDVHPVPLAHVRAGSDSPLNVGCWSGFGVGSFWV
jgi:hypothetical protein